MIRLDGTQTTATKTNPVSKHPIPEKDYLLNQLRPLPILPTQHIQHNRIGNQLRVVGVFLYSGGQRGLGLG